MSGRARHTPCLGLTMLALLLAGCGEPARPPAAPALVVPREPEAALAWVREGATDAEVLRARLGAWPLDEDPFRDAAATRVVLTWRLQVALQDDAVEEAESAWRILDERFGGRGRSPQGRDLPARVMRLGLFETALLAARRRVEGSRGDLEAARRALRIAAPLVGPQDEEDGERLRATSSWVEATTLAEVLAALDPALRLAARAHPRVVVLAGDFALGETLFTSVLGRWQRDGAAAGLTVEVVPLLRGQVRLGLRLVPADSREEELGSIAARLDGEGLAPPSVEAGVDAARGRALGLTGMDVAILVLDEKDRIVARLSGTNPDPRALDIVVERLVSR